MNRRAQAVVMLLLGGAVVRISLSGASLRYVKTGLRPVLVVAGLLLLACAVMTLWHDLRPAHGEGERDRGDGSEHIDEPALGHGSDGDDHGHAHHESRVGWLLILPVVGLLVVGPPALGAYSATSAGSVLAAQGAGSDYTPLPPGNPARLPLLDYASRAVYDGGKTLTGRTLQLTGFVTPAPTGNRCWSGSCSPAAPPTVVRSRWACPATPRPYRPTPG
jgi:uncharacterized repeat protein (TIGR03943 family)